MLFRNSGKSPGAGQASRQKIRKNRKNQIHFAAAGQSLCNTFYHRQISVVISVMVIPAGTGQSPRLQKACNWYAPHPVGAERRPTDHEYPKVVLMSRRRRIGQKSGTKSRSENTK